MYNKPALWLYEHHDRTYTHFYSTQVHKAVKSQLQCLLVWPFLGFLSSGCSQVAKPLPFHIRTYTTAHDSANTILNSSTSFLLLACSLHVPGTRQILAELQTCYRNKNKNQVKLNSIHDANTPYLSLGTPQQGCVVHYVMSYLLLQETGLCGSSGNGSGRARSRGVNHRCLLYWRTKRNRLSQRVQIARKHIS